MDRFTLISSDADFAWAICNALAKHKHEIQLFIPKKCFQRLEPRLKTIDKLSVVLSNESDEDRWVSEVLAFKPDLLICAIFNRKIPSRIFKIAPEAVNIHPAPLPEYRGADIWGLPIRYQEEETAITIHRITEEFDRGPICLAHPIRLHPRENLCSLMAKMKKELPQAWDKFYRAYQNNGLKFMPNEGGRYFSKYTYKDTWIEFDQGAETIDAMVRSLSSLTPANCLFKFRPISILETQLTDLVSVDDIPGRLFEKEGELLLATLDRYLEIRCLSTHDGGIFSSQTFIERHDQTLGSNGYLLSSCKTEPLLKSFRDRKLDY